MANPRLSLPACPYSQLMCVPKKMYVCKCTLHYLFKDFAFPWRFKVVIILNADD